MGNVTAKTSGEIASFMTPEKTNIKSLKVHFSPKQLGTGEPSPENVREIVGWDGVEVNGCGKNLFGGEAFKSAVPSIFLEEDEYGKYIRLNNVTNVNPIFTMPFKENTQYTFIGKIRRNITANTSELRIKYTDNTWSQLFTSTTNKDEIVILKSTSLKNKTIKGLYYLQRTINFDIYYNDFGIFEGDIPIESFKPYQGNTISYQWKLPDEYQEVEYIESTGTQYIKTNISTNNLISVDLLAQFTEGSDVSQVLFSASTNGVNWFGQRDNVYACGVSDISKSTVDSTQKSKIHIAFSDNSIVCTIGDNTFSRKDSVHQNGQLYILFNTDYPSKAKIFYCIIYNDDIAIANLVPCYRKSDNEIGMYDIVNNVFYTNKGTGTFLKGKDVNKTFYGGYVDLISGELVEEYYLKVFTGDENIQLGNWGVQSFLVNDYKQSATPFITTNNLDDIYCNILTPKISGFYGMEEGKITCLGSEGEGFKYVIWKDEIFGDTIESCKAKLKELYESGTPLIFSSKVAEVYQKHYQLTPTQLSSFIGQNNFWSNADYIEIEYELKETEDIQKARKKIILNQPHIESINGDIANFTTNMKAPLKECKVYFEPIQEGSGDPSPDNVRNIIGWDGVSVGLPSEYQEVEYIESTGFSWLETSINIKKNDIVSSELIFQNTSSYNYNVWFAGDGMQKDNLQHEYGFYGGNYGYLDNGIIAKYEYGENKYFSKTKAYFLNRTYNSNVTLTWRVGSRNGYNDLEITNCPPCKIWYNSFTINGNKVLEFIPCYRKSDGEIGMYDTVSKTFYTNSGTGTFLKGDDVNTIIGNVSWSDEVGTVYGGYVDLAKGEVVAEYFGFIADGENIKTNRGYVNDTSYGAGIVYMDRYGFPDSDRLRVNTYCNTLNPIRSTSQNCVYWVTNGGFYLVFYPFSKTTEESKASSEALEETNEWLKQHPTQIVYKLRTPIRYQLTPQQLLTFKGENNIWSDTNGQTEVKFWTH